MKVCRECGVEICTKDYDNLCVDCEYGGVRIREERVAQREEFEDVYRLLGLVRVVGHCGGVYWE